MLGVKASTNGGDVVATIRDNGPGMTPEVREHLFDPFFTTKAHGTGLGLSTVQMIVQQHGGNISVKTSVGKGTEIRLGFPPA